MQMFFREKDNYLLYYLCFGLPIETALMLKILLCHIQVTLRQKLLSLVTL